MGLLARATEILEREQQAAALAAKTATQTASLTTVNVATKSQNTEPVATAVKYKPQPTIAATNTVTVQDAQNDKRSRRHKLRRLVLSAMFGLGLTTAMPSALNRMLLPTDLTWGKSQTQEHSVHNHTNVDQAIEQFQKGLTSRVSNAERDMIAQMVYGEAGRGADPFEVIHTVLNRMSSPLFKSTAADIITQKDQYIGYKATNPITHEYRRMVDIAVDDWEANGCQKVSGCDHFYFVTGIPNVCNKFEISHDHQGHWVSNDQKDYAPMQHYCAVATDQAARYFAEANHADRTL